MQKQIINYWTCYKPILDWGFFVCQYSEEDIKWKDVIDKRVKRLMDFLWINESKLIFYHINSFPLIYQGEDILICQIQVQVNAISKSCSSKWQFQIHIQSISDSNSWTKKVHCTVLCAIINFLYGQNKFTTPDVCYSIAPNVCCYQNGMSFGQNNS